MESFIEGLFLSVLFVCWLLVFTILVTFILNVNVPPNSENSYWKHLHNSLLSHWSIFSSVHPLLDGEKENMRQMRISL
jgi:hypothetical protein